MTSQIFAQPSAVKAPPKEYGTVHNGRYHMPLLPGETGPKDGSPWVSRGLRRMTNLVGAAEDTRALSVWEQAVMLIGLAQSPELYEELVVLLAGAEHDGVDALNLKKEHPDLRQILAGAVFDQPASEASFAGRAKAIARGNAAATMGTVRHAAWEHFCKTGNLIGTPAVQESTLRCAALLADAGLKVIPGLQERVVRNVALGAVGKFDNVLMDTRNGGRLVMADLKTKVNPFFSRMALDAQLAGYARAEWMLATCMSHDGLFAPGEWYEPGPVEYVDQTEAVVMHVPSDGAPAILERCDLEYGWRVCLNAKEAIELRAHGKAAGTHERAMQWGQKDLEITS